MDGEPSSAEEGEQRRMGKRIVGEPLNIHIFSPTPGTFQKLYMCTLDGVLPILGFRHTYAANQFVIGGLLGLEIGWLCLGVEARSAIAF